MTRIQYLIVIPFFHGKGKTAIEQYLNDSRGVLEDHFLFKGVFAASVIKFLLYINKNHLKSGSINHIPNRAKLI